MEYKREFKVRLVIATGTILFIVSLGGIIIYGAIVSVHEKDYAENVIKKSYLEHGCYLDDNLPVTKFTDWYQKDGYICPK